MPDLYSASNDMFIAGSLLIATCLCFFTIRFLYHIGDSRHNAIKEYYTSGTQVAVEGLKVFKLLCFIILLVSAILSFRVNTYLSVNDFWTISALSRSYWCIIRMGVSFIVSLSAYLFDANPFCRLLCTSFMACLSLVDFASELDFANQIYCMDQGICSYDDSNHYRYRLYAFRDLASAILNLAGAGLACWLTGLFGPCSNDIYLPHREHRYLSRRLDKLNLGPKKIVRDSDETTDDINIAKLFGF